MSDGDGVVDRGAVPAVCLAVVDGEEVDEVGDERTDRPGSAQPLLNRGRRHRQVRDVEADHRHVDARVVDGLSGLRVGPDVELGGRGHVALSGGTAHRDDPLDVGATGALEQQRDVGQRAGRHERDGLRAGGDRPLQEVDRVLAERIVPGRRQRRTVEAAVAVDVRRDRQLPFERAVGAGSDRDVGAAGEIEHAQRIRRRLLERLVAVDRGDAENLELGAREREQQCDRVVVPRVAVEDDRDRGAHARSIAVVAEPTLC